MTAAVSVLHERYLRCYDCGREHVVSSQAYLPSNRVAASDGGCTCMRVPVHPIRAPGRARRAPIQNREKEKTAYRRLVVRRWNGYGSSRRRLEF